MIQDIEKQAKKSMEKRLMHFSVSFAVYVPVVPQPISWMRCVWSTMVPPFL